MIQSAGQQADSNNPTDVSTSGVRYFDGVVDIPGPSMTSPGGGDMPFGETVDWTNGPYAAEEVTGTGTTDPDLPYLVSTDGGETIEVIDDTTAEFFDKTGGNGYQARFFDQNRLIDPANTFTLITTSGYQYVFADFSSNYPTAEQGQLLTIIDPYGNTTNLSYNSAGQLTEAERSFASNGNLTTEAYFYTYLTATVNAGLLQNVALERETNGGSWNVVQQIAFTYYDGTQPYGNVGDLQTAVVEDGSGNELDTYYYRYYTPGAADGYTHGLMFYFDADSEARLAAAVGDIFTATNTQAAPYATDYLEYNSQHQVTQITEAGAGGDATGGLGTYTYSYTASTNAPGYNSWAVKTVEGLPNGSENIVYANAYGEVMLTVFVDAASGLQWLDYYRYDNLGRAVLFANPSAMLGYNDSYADLVNYQDGTYQYVSADSGLLTSIVYYQSTTATATTAGGVYGYEESTSIEQGYAGTPILQESWQYFQQEGEPGGAPTEMTVAPIATDTVYRNDDGTGAETTSYSYTWFSGTVQMESMTTSLPLISAAQNGSGLADVSTSVFDIYGNDIWDRDADGYIDYTAYNLPTDAVVESIVDVNTADTGEFQNLPAGWQTPTGGGLNLVTAYTVDDLGRTTEEVDPNGEITYTVYNDPDHEYRVYTGWNTTTDLPTGPTQVYRYDMAAGYEEILTMSAVPNLTDGVPNGTEPIGDVQTLSRIYYNLAGQEVREDDYFNLSGVTYSTAPYIGTVNVNYYTTLYGYDSDGNQDRVVDPTGTITDTVYDSLDRTIAIYVGTNDTPGSSNMVETNSYVYDNGGVGDSNLTQETDYPGGGAAPRVTDYFYNWRDEEVIEQDAPGTTGANAPIYVTTYDNLGEDVADAMYTGDGVTISTVDGVPQAPVADLLRAYSTTEYDSQGNVYQTNTYDVNPTNGNISTYSLTTNYYYDADGNQIAESDPGGLWTKDTYNGAGWVVTQYTTDGGSGTTWADASTVANDTVLEQVTTLYDGNGNPIETIDAQRLPNATGTGPLGTPTSGVGARVYYSGTYYDLTGRPIADVDVGTNGGTAWVMPSTVPASSATVLVTSYGYNAAGFQDSTTDPMGIVDYQVLDALGRVTEDIEDYTDGVPTDDSNQTTDYTYDGDNDVLTVTAVQPSGTPSQTTQYVYGVTTAQGSDINSNDLLAATLYPDPTTGEPSTSQEETYTYNALGQETSYTDRDGNMHEYLYDVLGRQVSDIVTTLGAGVDGSVRRIDTAYDQQGNAYLFTSYADTAGTQVVNQVEDFFNGLGQLTMEYQSQNGPVDLDSTPPVIYSYTEMSGGQNNSRLISITYPSAYQVDYNYDPGLDDSISRLSSISDNTGILESYVYLGVGTVVEWEHPQTGVDETYISPTGSIGPAGDDIIGLDQFGRVVDDAYINALTGQYTDDFLYTYDQDGDVTSMTNALNSALSQTYTYNGLLELTGYTQGDGTSQSYTEDALGNITSVTTDGTTQTRTSNAQNELTSVSGAVTPTYDANGNLTTDEIGQVYTYNAWNQLVGVTGPNGTVSYTYDALGRRVTETTNGATQDIFFDGTNPIEERAAGSGTPNMLYVWSPVSSNTLVLRERDTTGNGVLNERLWYQYDANNNVSAVLNDSGTVIEEYSYSPFGTMYVYAPNGTPLTQSTVAQNYGYQGMRIDQVTGNYHTLGREYRPSIEVWTGMDPISYDGGQMNLLEMEGDNPVNGVDPWGMSVISTAAKALGKKNFYNLMKKQLKKLLLSQFVQVHHIIMQKFFKGEMGAFLKAIGFEKNGLKNLVALPNNAGKALGIAGKKALHEGGHAKQYVELVEKALKEIKDAFECGAVTKDEALQAVNALAQRIRKGLKNGTIQIHTPEALNSILPFALLGATAAEKEELADQLAEFYATQVEKAMAGHIFELGRATHYTGKEGASGWFGWIVDLINPLDDIATVADVLTAFDYDPTKETPQQYWDRIRGQ